MEYRILSYHNSGKFMVDDIALEQVFCQVLLDLHCSLSFPDDFIGNEENGVWYCTFQYIRLEALIFYFQPGYIQKT